MKSNRLRGKNIVRELTVSAMFASLIFCAVYFIKIPVLSGYVHPGDGLIFIAAVWLPTPYAMAATAIGTGLADLIGGYPLWLPVTVAVRLIYVPLFERGKIFSVRNYLALAAATVITAGGYWLFETFAVYHSPASAAMGIPFNLLQSMLGAVVFLASGRLLDKRQRMKEWNKN